MQQTWTPTLAGSFEHRVRRGVCGKDARHGRPGHPGRVARGDRPRLVQPLPRRAGHLHAARPVDDRVEENVQTPRRAGRDVLRAVEVVQLLLLAGADDLPAREVGQRRADPRARPPRGRQEALQRRGDGGVAAH